MIHTYRKKDRSFLKYSTSTIVVGPVTPTQIFLSYGPELLYTILNVNPKLQPSK